MASNQAAELIPLISHEQIETTFWKALRMFVGRGKRHSADEVSKGAGVHRRTLDCYRGYPIGHPDHRPLDLGQKFSIASYIGADLTTQWLLPIGQAAFDLPDEEPDPGALAADNSDDNADLTRKALDGTFENDCPKEVSALGARMMSRGARLVAVARTAA